MHVLQNFLNLKEPPSHGDWAQTGETFNYVFILRQVLVPLRLLLFYLQFMGSIC